MPPTASGLSPDASTASRTADVAARQMSSDDCSTISPGSRQIAIGRRALAMSAPAESNTPALALSVPTSTPIKASRMEIPGLGQENSPFPASLASGSAEAGGARGRPGPGGFDRTVVHSVYRNKKKILPF